MIEVDASSSKVIFLYDSDVLFLSWKYAIAKP